MLQQTQTSRVVPYYENFLRLFPSFEALAAAPLSTVLAAWQGLGYNRRGVFLKRLAEAVVANHGGALPNDEALLRELPGIGKYTAGAVMSFAFDSPAVFIETNIRAVFLHHFLLGKMPFRIKRLKR